MLDLIATRAARTLGTILALGLVLFLFFDLPTPPVHSRAWAIFFFTVIVSLAAIPIYFALRIVANPPSTEHREYPGQNYVGTLGLACVVIGIFGTLIALLIKVAQVADISWGLALAPLWIAVFGFFTLLPISYAIDQAADKSTPRWMRYAGVAFLLFFACLFSALWTAAAFDNRSLTNSLLFGAGFALIAWVSALIASAALDDFSS